MREGLSLCPIVPLVVYHGESGWSAAQCLSDLIRYPDGLSEYQPEFVFRLLDLSRLSDSEITGDVVLQSTLRLLKYSRSRQLVEKLVDILTSLAGALLSSSLPAWIEAVGVYLMSVNRDIDAEHYKQTLASVLPVQYEPGSLADRLLIQGREEGRKEGREEIKLVVAGQIQLLEELLGDTLTTDAELQSTGLDALTMQLADLQQRLRDRPS
ncbi:MAG: Rpn family recombination-promoting nuclease/putative transposase [Planctomycetales bacterium]|nr:Rpn family recombination-promoting nuclease/putative transposase [Planctomycetales bacterium]